MNSQKLETILRIEEGSFKNKPEDYRGYDGYLIITNKQTIKIGMNMDQDCCERPGYFWSVDDVQAYVGATLKKIEVVDETINKLKFDKETDGFYEGGMMYVNFETSKGLLQFTAYNEQNGYYGHEAVVISEQLKLEEYL